MENSMYNNGFTLIETLFALFVTTLILLTLPLYVKQISTYQPYETITDFEVYQLFHFISLDLTNTAYFIEGEEGIDLYQVNGDVISIEQYGTSIRRRVNRKGHELLVHGVANFQVHLPRQHVMKLTVTSERGITYTKYHSIPPKRERIRTTFRFVHPRSSLSAPFLYAA
ncbi:ComGF family competence protein [Pontibacillus litoralis]|uniref:Competence protein ComG n=1 Tax=Pontibacillus litoralis JSM 072002 TaxID=1385512 RepID=A0A0A5GDI6_9BACI|nr:ComGF family competence protein [Pontibacillus litoralis]KGX89185.1 hypothetical protein N784_00535 [Pontibacillus litoralis JSM 072002]